MIERTGPAIREALREAAPDELPAFEVEFRAALADTEIDFDAARIDEVLTRWWAAAVLASDPVPVEEVAFAHRCMSEPGLTLGQAAKQLGVSCDEVERRVRDGALRGYWLGHPPRRFRIS
ncbi:DNA binding domain-containing protein, excisionase family [Tsukamurella pulmonis]|uniref:DNA binding domain-containing protein, excisionase family n=1 Tax=Tsukamurella pulmonis TaxID=47312 RepID=A0A1H1H5I5_9ACTN|nr:DUF6247 family protein [Tsukamurella pulmonis]SDR20752.1 DNA binding domain-containing protein, excisionase family [Tsukamurella pulmonis]SUP15881.1 Uncharacterised protein [Tsukamurella pulmonis]